MVLRSPTQSLRFIVRQGHLICSIDDTLSILRSLVLGGHLIHAEQLYRELRARFFAECEAGVASYQRIVQQMVATCILALSGIETYDSLVLELRYLGRLLSDILKSSCSSESEQRDHHAYAYGTLGGESLWSKGFAATNDPDPAELALMLETAQQLARLHGSVEHPRGRPVMRSPFRPSTGRRSLAI